MRVKKRRSTYKKEYFYYVPLVFAVIGFLISAVIFSIIFSGSSESLDLFFKNNKNNFDYETENIYTPLEESPMQEGVFRSVDAADVVYPRQGQQFGEFSIDDKGVSVKLFYGDGAKELDSGVGLYSGSFIPGYGKTVLISGHNSTFFSGLQNVVKGDEVTIKTSYGTSVYRISETAVRNVSDKDIFNLTAKTESLVFYTCYPFNTVGLSGQRLFFYADLISGPKIINIESEVEP